MFGIAPCPMTIFTIGVLMLGDWKDARSLAADRADALVVHRRLGCGAARCSHDHALIFSGILVVEIAAGRLRSPRLSSAPEGLRA